MNRFLANPLNPHSTSNESKDLTSHIKQTQPSALKKSFLKTYYLIWKSLHPIRAHTIKKYTSLSVTLIRQVQLLSLILTHNTSSSNSVVSQIFSVFMFDSYKLASQSQDLFTTFSLIFGYFMLSCVFCIFVQVHLKKNMLINPLVFGIKFLSFGVCSVLMIPMINNALFYISNNSVLNSSFLDSEALKKFVFCLQFFSISGHVLLTNLFAYDSDYFSSEPKSRSCSLVTLKQELTIILMCILNNLIPDIYFLLFAEVLALYLFKNFTFSMPYYKFYENILDSALWMTVSTLTLLQIIDVLVGIDGQAIVVFLFVTPLQYVLLGHYMKRIKELYSRLEIRDPMMMELRIREILYGKREIEEEEMEMVEKIFEKATLEFLEFMPVWIWECNFVVQVREDYALAAVKLLKIRFSKNRPKVLSKPRNLHSYPYSLECEFHSYSLLKKLKKFENFKDVQLIKYIQDLILFKQLDSKACTTFMSIIDNQLHSSSSEQSFHNFFTTITEKNTFFSKSVKKYGNDFNFAELNSGFSSSLMCANASGSSITSTKTREFYLERLTGNNNINNLATAVLSANTDSFCDLLYVNPLLVSLLKHPDENSLIGLNYEDLFHEFFHNQKETFYRYLLKSNSHIFNIDQVFLEDFYGYALEFALEVRITFFKGVCYFVINLQPVTNFLNFVLIDKSGNILSCSDRLKNVFTAFNKTIDELLPGFMQLLNTKPESEEFSYTGFSNLCLFEYKVVSNGTENGFVVYTNEQEQSLTFNGSEHKRAERKKSLTFNGQILDDRMGLKRTFSVNKRKSRMSFEVVKNLREKFVDKSSVVEKLMKALKYGNIVAICGMVCIYLSMIFFFAYFVDVSQFVLVLQNIISIRYNLISTLMSLRSIDLLQSGIACNNNYNTYVQTIQTNTATLQTWLDYIRDYDPQFSTQTIFEHSTIIIYTYTSTGITQSSSNLYQTIYTFNQKMTSLLSNNFSDPLTFQYLYKNSFETLQSKVNQTILVSLNKITEQALLTFLPLTILNILSFFPFSCILILSFFIISKLQLLNRQLNTRISLIPNKTFVVMRTRIVDRIKKLHDSEFDQDFEVLENKPHIKSLWKKYFLLLSLLVAAVIGYTFVVQYVFQAGFEETATTRLEFRFLAGSRTAAAQSFLWSREAGLRKIGKGYLNIITDYTQVYDERARALSELSKMKYLNAYGNGKGLELNQRFDFSPYVSLLFGNPCQVLNMSGCLGSILQFGTGLACNSLWVDLSNFVDSTNFSNSQLVKQEKSVQMVLKSLQNNLSIFDSCADFLGYYQRISISVTCMVVGLVVVYFFGLIIPELSKLKKSLLSRNALLKFFEFDKQTNENSFAM